MAVVFTFENGKQICFDRTIYANGKYVLFKDYQLLDEERRAVRDQLTRANNQIDDLKEQIAKLEKTRSSLDDNAVEWREKCEKDEKKIKELEHELRKKDNSETYGLDFTEHDKELEDKIAELENIINHKLGDWDEHGIPYKEILDMKSENQELKQRIAELESKETEKPTKINLNETIKAKLTPYGAEIYYKQFDELNKQYGREMCKPLMPRIDKDGYTEFQLWHFMELYGQHIGMCKPNVIEPLEIVYCRNDKCHPDHAE